MVEIAIVLNMFFFFKKKISNFLALRSEVVSKFIIISDKKIELLNV